MYNNYMRRHYKSTIQKIKTKICYNCKVVINVCYYKKPKRNMIFCSTSCKKEYKKELFRPINNRFELLDLGEEKNEKLNHCNNCCNVDLLLIFS